MTDDDWRVKVELYVEKKLEAFDKVGIVHKAKPELFVSYGERIHGSCEGFFNQIEKCDGGGFLLMCGAMRMYWDKFTGDNPDVRFINKVCVAIMERGASRPVAWEHALAYHGELVSRYPLAALDDIEVTFASPDEAQAMVERHQQSGPLN